VTFGLNLEQLRKQPKERVRERRTAGVEVKLAEVQFELAHELGHPAPARTRQPRHHQHLPTGIDSSEISTTDDLRRGRV
jgi:hypothetical protein